jgi:DNA-binding transcriptional MocR family regulator
MSGSAPAYRQIADQLQQLIDSGALKINDKLPSIRQLSRTHGVSMPTVQRAMSELEMRGMVEARARSGFYVSANASRLIVPKSVPHLVTLTGSTPLSAIVHKVYAVSDRAGICALGPEGPSAELFPTIKLHRAMNAAARRAGARGCDYAELAGSIRLREEIARRSPASGACLRPEEIIITAGCTEAVTLCLRAVTKPGDTVVVESPAFYGVLLALESLGLHPLELPVSGNEGLDIDALEKTLVQKRIAAVLVGANFNNPHGGLMPDRSKQRLVDLLTLHAVPLIEDDIYGDLHFGPRRPPSLKAYDRNGLVLLCESFSKSVAPGYRVGWTSPGRFLERVLELKFAQCNFSAVLPQLGIAEFLRSGGYERHVRRLRSTFSLNVQRMARLVTETFPKNTQLTAPLGGMFLWVELPAPCNAMTLHDAAQRLGISLAPGPMFSATATRFSRHVRLNCSRIWSAELEHGIKTLGRLACEQQIRLIASQKNTVMH